MVDDRALDRDVGRAGHGHQRDFVDRLEAARASVTAVVSAVATRATQQRVPPLLKNP